MFYEKPKSLKAAVRAGLEVTSKSQVRIENSASKEKVEIAHAVILDFLAHKFTPDLMSDPKIQHLWRKIRGAA